MSSFRDRRVELAVAIIKKSDRLNPADSVLRTELKNRHGLSRADSREVSRMVFAYYRWNGWLEAGLPVHQKIFDAEKLNSAFQADPSSIPEAELFKAVPDWALEMTDGGNSWFRELLKEPALWIRARKGQGMAVAEELKSCVRRTEPGFEDVLRYDGQEDLFRQPGFQTGKFELQDISSQAVGLLCTPEPGETWWDACAGQGGKTMHLCDLMMGKGTVWATDRAEWRLKQLKLRASRAQIFNYRAALWDGGSKLPNKNKFDGILVDAPCSGLGTWQRNPHARWTTTPGDVRELAETQLNLLSNVAGALKPHGRLIYAVCTVTRAETVEVAEKFSKKFPDLKPISFSNPFQPGQNPTPHLYFWPHQNSGNGMFVSGWQH